MRRVQRTFLVFVLLTAISVGVSAQRSGMDVGQPGVEPRKISPNSGEAIAVGPFLFSPALQLSWQHQDNIFFTAGNEVADSLWLARARFQFELPIYESYILFAYTPQYRDYATYELEDKWGHFFDFIGDFEFANGLVLDTTYRYVKSNLETREVDPGGELFWSDRLFQKHFVAANLDYWFSNRDGISFFGDYTDLKYDEPDIFYDYRRVYAGIGWLHQLSDVLVMKVAYGHIDFKPDNTIQYRTSSSDEVALTFEGQINPVMSTGITVGYRKTRYDTQEGDPDVPDVPDYGGLIAKGFFNWELGHSSALRLDLLRSDYPSNFGINANYVATGGSLVYRYDRNRLFGNARYRYQVNDYAMPDLATGLERRDPITTWGLGLGYRFGSYFSIWGGYLNEDRGSNIHRYSYKNAVYTLGLIVGY
jgi:hypothetical protein